MGTDPRTWKYYDGTPFEGPYIWDLKENPEPQYDFGIWKSLIIWHFNPKSKSFCDLPSKKRKDKLL